MDCLTVLPWIRMPAPFSWACCCPSCSSAAFSTSPEVIRPPGPVPFMRVMSSIFSSAIFRATGVILTRSPSSARAAGAPATCGDAASTAWTDADMGAVSLASFSSSSLVSARSPTTVPIAALSPSARIIWRKPGASASTFHSTFWGLEYEHNRAFLDPITFLCLPFHNCCVIRRQTKLGDHYLRCHETISSVLSKTIQKVVRYS